MEQHHSRMILIRNRHRVLAVAAVVIASLTVGACSDEESRRPHIFLISADALRADHLSLNGYPRATSPSIDEFASSSTQFEEAITPIPKTGPAIASVLTGWHPETHGVRTNLQAIPDQAPALPQILRERGYTTAAVVCNPVLQRSLGFDRGFDEFALRVNDSGIDAVEKIIRPWSRRSWRQPTFLWVHFLEPHGPYTPPSDYVDLFAGDEIEQSDLRRATTAYEPLPGYHRSKVLGAIPDYQLIDGEDRVGVYVRNYDAHIRFLDDAFGALIRIIRERGIFEESAIIFLSDHGESLGEHNYYFEHGWFAYEPGIRIPLILKNPHQSEGERTSAQVSLLDIFPTVLSLADIDHPYNGPGESLNGPLNPSRSVVIENAGQYPVRVLGFRMHGIKFLVDQGTGAQELYDLNADPTEATNLVAERPRHAEQAFTKYQNLLHKLGKAAQPGKTADSPEIEHIEKLRSLGYVQ